MKTASVVIDVVAKNINQTFTYLIPDYLDQINLLGYRVIVPFGKRKLMGFVVSISSKKINYNQFNLKKIETTLGKAPILNQEMIDLSEYLSKKLFSSQIQVIKAMLPAAFKVKYLKELKIVKPVSPNFKKEIFFDKKEIVYYPNNYNQSQKKVIKKFIREGKIAKKTKIKEDLHLKTLPVYNCILSKIQLKKIFKDKKRSKQQRKLIQFFLSDHKGSYTKKEIEEIIGVSSAVLKRAVKKGWISVKNKRLLRNPENNLPSFKKTKPLKLNPVQQKIFNQIERPINENKKDTFLLEGVTGSGKTEVYLQLIQKTILLGKSVILLVPEITLTSQILNRVRSRFGSNVALMHSGLSNGEKLDEWEKIKKYKIPIIVGTRSAIFAPLDNLGLIIIDEEQDDSYKQENNPRYHARDVALWRSNYNQSVVLLGSATPSLESRARAQKNVFKFLKLPYRAVKGSELPEIRVIDMKKAWQDPQSYMDFSPQLINNLKLTYNKNEQTILLLNRRGFSSFLMCRNCGYVPRCPNCNLSLTIHINSHTLKCHYCGYQRLIPRICPKCQSKEIRYVGTGTEKVERELKNIFPFLRISRLDQDSINKKGSLGRILSNFSAQKYDLLLGTQMVAKGFDFPNVTLVGIINADTSLNIPSYRAEEKTFQLLTQVSGRSGRAKKRGKVIIQTYNPNNYAIRLAAKQDYEKFFRLEMRYRHIGEYSPYFYIIQIVVSGLNQFVTSQSIKKVFSFIKNKVGKKTIILGPTVRAIAKFNKRYFFQIILKYKYDPQLPTAIRELQKNFSKNFPKSLYLTIDKNPVSFI